MERVQPRDPSVNDECKAGASREREGPGKELGSLAIALQSLRVR